MTSTHLKLRCQCGNDDFRLVAEKMEGDFRGYYGATVYSLCSKCNMIALRTGLEKFAEANFGHGTYVVPAIEPDEDLIKAANQ